ncbi:PRC and DUF2382 domain-containing protein [Actinoplanes sp. N902-109]|uniref:PRC and DUF2382 domain-containing protein n=1 Tax=Actinoplanes sp. (strain N902-109) TaxID=649831 RepID=UPI00032960B2|nr:PRC and DUF2382 domain-containing protein [Actinoplanes sp. N902-109]AGL15982.1 hypothetical protein L083_2472 [Actinoplanes sp. N902-109]
MLTQNEIPQLSDATVYDADGDKIGSVGQVFLDAQSGEPEWVTVKTGLFGTKETFVPLQRADVSGDRITVPVDKATVKDAPRIDTDSALTYAEEDELYRYYGLTSDTSGSGSNAYEGNTGAKGREYTENRTGQTGTEGRSESFDNRAAGSYGKQTSEHSRHSEERDSGLGGSDAMTRSEERLVADTQREEAGRARLRKYVVTEEQQVKVPVSREEVRLEREPITEANRGDAFDGPSITESEHEVTLHAERPVVNTEAVPVERVRLGKETVRDEETVTGQVRKEQIDFDDPEGRR